MMLTELFTAKDKLTTKDFMLALIASIAVFLVACWAFGFVLTMVGVSLSIIKIIVSLFSILFAARISVLVMRVLKK